MVVLYACVPWSRASIDAILITNAAGQYRNFFLWNAASTVGLALSRPIASNQSAVRGPGLPQLPGTYGPGSLKIHVAGNLL
jgi:hypothetical protein